MTEDTSRRSRRESSDAAFVVLAVGAGVFLLYIGRSLTFWQDEWRYITFTGSGIDFLRPVNEHWSTVPLLLYRATFGVFELGSYVPYLAEVILLHVFAVTAAYVLMRRRAGPLVATAMSIPLLVLGAGSENLFWAFQTGFVGSVAFGLWALVFVERGGRWSTAVASLLLLVSLMSSGMGLVFLIVAFARTILDRARRRRALVTVPPAMAYLVWYLLVGHDAVNEPGHVAGPRAVAEFVVRGITHSIGGFTGSSSQPGGHVITLALFVVLLIASGWGVLNGRPRALAAGCVLVSRSPTPSWVWSGPTWVGATTQPRVATSTSLPSCSSWPLRIGFHTYAKGLCRDRGRGLR